MLLLLLDEEEEEDGESCLPCLNQVNLSGFP